MQKKTREAKRQERREQRWVGEKKRSRKGNWGDKKSPWRRSRDER